MNSTDLHIKYRMETGEWHQWSRRTTWKFHDTDSYSREYAKWLEDQLLEELKKKKDIENLEEEVEYLQNALDESNEETRELMDEIEYLKDLEAGDDLQFFNQ